MLHCLTAGIDMVDHATVTDVGATSIDVPSFARESKCWWSKVLERRNPTGNGFGLLFGARTMDGGSVCLLSVSSHASVSHHITFVLV